MSDSSVHRIPSISQLMELRPLKDLAHKVSSSTVTAGIKAYLQPYQKMAMEAAPTLPYTSLQGLASEISDWILGERAMNRPEVINATGQVLGSRFPVGPLAEEIVVQAHARRHDYREAQAQSNFRAAIEQLLCEMTGAQSALVLKDRQAVIFLKASALASRQMVVPRSQMSATFDGINLPKLLEEIGGVQEIGASNQIDFAELKDNLAGKAEWLLWFDKTNFEGPGTGAIPPTSEAIETLKSTDVKLWADLGVAGLLSDEIHDRLALTSAKQALSAGADVVSLGGGFLTGGPDCGIILGSTEEISELRRLPIAPYLQAGAEALAELEICLRVHQSEVRIEDRIPVLSLLSTPIENLDLRATRLAEQLVVSPWIEEAATAAGEASVLPGGVKLATRHVVLKLSAEEKQSLKAHLQSFPGTLCLSYTDDEVVIDMRTLFPRQDSELVGKVVPEIHAYEGCEDEKFEK